MKVVYFESGADFRRWLQSVAAQGSDQKPDGLSDRLANKPTNRPAAEPGGQLCQELWVGFYKKSSGKPSITYPEAVDEALCFGWIDGLRKSIDAHAYTIRFTPRKPKSQWSTVNIRHVDRLMAAGRMHPIGLKAFEGAKDQPRKYSYEQRNEACFDAADERRFRSNPRAWEFFQSQPPWYRRTATFWVISAKKEETRQKRLATVIADSGRGKSLKALDRTRYPSAGQTETAQITTPRVPKRSKKRQ